MSRTTRRITALMAATTLLALALATTNASAGRLSASEQAFRISWNSIEFVGAATIRCRVTLEGSFHTRTIAKVRGSLIGAISRARIAHPCTGGEAWTDNGIERQPLGTAPNRLPFHLTYESFAGTLPSISSLTFLASRVSYVIEATVLGFNCRGRYGRAEDNISGTVSRETGSGALGTNTPVEGLNRASLVDQLGANAVCSATGAFRGTSNPVGTLSTGARITITLI